MYGLGWQLAAPVGFRRNDASVHVEVFKERPHGVAYETAFCRAASRVAAGSGG